jgi:hypothetical protein
MFVVAEPTGKVTMSHSDGRPFPPRFDPLFSRFCLFRSL